MRRTARHATGSVIPDKRRGTWNLLRRNWQASLKIDWDETAVSDQSQRLGSSRESPVQTAREAARRHDGSFNRTIRKRTHPGTSFDASVYRWFLRHHILLKWGTTLIEDVQPREVELWLRGLELAPKTRSHLRNLLHVLLEFAMWAGMLPCSGTRWS